MPTKVEVTAAGFVEKIAVYGILVTLVFALAAFGLAQASACDRRGGVLVKDAIGRHVCVASTSVPVPARR